MSSTLYDIEVTHNNGMVKKMAQYQGKVLLIVNTASQCGFTPQYQGLQDLYEKYVDQGFVVLGFPCNQFANQEPDDDESIQSFCSLHFDVTFPLFSKVEVNGSNAHPLYQHLKSAKKGFLAIEAIKWNFTKFLVDKKGNVVNRFAPQTKPEQLVQEIEELLKMEIK